MTEMNRAEFCDVPIVDCHFHFEHLESEERLLESIREAGFKSVNLVSVIDQLKVNFNPEVVYMKFLHPDLFYAFGALDYSAVFRGSNRAEPNLVTQVDTLIRIGLDGIKMGEGKPTYRKILKTPFNSEFYEDYFERVEHFDLPIIFHVADPEEFWSPEEAPRFAKRAGWIYDDTYPKKEDLYGEVKDVLDNHPRLKIIFPHFYFLSGDLERTADLLDEYRNVHLDVTAGSEMYYNFYARLEDWREFFIHYQDRILFGTDNFDETTKDEAFRRLRAMRTFLEKDKPVTWGSYENKKEPLRGFLLPRHVLTKIYSENFERVAGRTPREIDVEAAREECQRLREGWNREWQRELQITS